MKQRLCANVIDGERCNDPLRYHKREGACARGWRQTVAYEDDLPFWYAFGEPGDECRCPGFVAPPTELRRRGRKSAKRGARNERIALRAGPGRPDLVSDDESYEVKTFRLTKAMRDHFAQSSRLSGGRTPIVRLVDGQRVFEVRELIADSERPSR